MFRRKIYLCKKNIGTLSNICRCDSKITLALADKLYSEHGHSEQYTILGDFQAKEL